MYRWKLDLYSSTCQIVEKTSEEEDSRFIFSEQRKIVEEPFTTVTQRILFGFEDAGQSEDFGFVYWRKHFTAALGNLLDVNRTYSMANTLTCQLQPLLFSKRDWDLLAVGASVDNLDKGAVIIEKGTPVSHLYHINSGTCNISIVPDQVVTSCSDSDFFGEISYLKMSSSASASAIVDSKKASVTKISFDRLTSILSGSGDLAMRFFRLLCFVSGRNYLRRASRIQAHELEDERGEETTKSKAGQEVKRETKIRKTHPAILKLKLDEIAPDEEVLQEYQCKLKKTKFSGSLYVMKEYIGFYSQVFGKKTRLLVPGKSVTEVVPRDDFCIYINNLKRDVGPFELQFKSIAQKEEAYTILASFLSDQKRSLAARTGVNYTAPRSGRQGSIFGMDNQHWMTLISNSPQYSVPKGDVILRQGTMNDMVLVIMDGQCRVETNVSGNPVPIVNGEMGVGEFIGCLSFILGVVSNVSVIASTDVVVAGFSRETLETFLTVNPDFSISFYKFVSRVFSSQLRKLEARFVEMEELEDHQTPVAPVVSVVPSSERGPIPVLCLSVGPSFTSQPVVLKESTDEISGSPNSPPRRSTSRTKIIDISPPSEDPPVPLDNSPSSMAGWIRAKKSPMPQQRRQMTSGRLTLR